MLMKQAGAADRAGRSGSHKYTSLVSCQSSLGRLPLKLLLDTRLQRGELGTTSRAKKSATLRNGRWHCGREQGRHVAAAFTFE